MKNLVSKRNQDCLIKLLVKISPFPLTLDILFVSALKSLYLWEKKDNLISFLHYKQAFIYYFKLCHFYLIKKKTKTRCCNNVILLIFDTMDVHLISLSNNSLLFC